MHQHRLDRYVGATLLWATTTSCRFVHSVAPRLLHRPASKARGAEHTHQQHSRPNLFQVLLRHISMDGKWRQTISPVSMFPWAQLRSDAINLISGGHAVSRFFLNGSLRLGEYRAQRSAIEAPKLTLFPASSIVPWSHKQPSQAESVSSREREHCEKSTPSSISSLNRVSRTYWTASRVLLFAFSHISRAHCTCIPPTPQVSCRRQSSPV